MAKIIVMYMDGTWRLIQAPPDTTVEIRDYDHALCGGKELPIKRDENDEPYEVHVLERP